MCHGLHPSPAFQQWNSGNSWRQEENSAWDPTITWVESWCLSSLDALWRTKGSWGKSDSRATRKSLKLVSVCNFFHTPNYFLNNCWRVREILSGKSPSFSRTAVEKGIKDVIRPVAFSSFDQLQYLELQLLSQCGDVISFFQHNSVSSFFFSFNPFISITAKLFIIWKIMKTSNLISINIGKESKLIRFTSLLTLLHEQ